MSDYSDQEPEGDSDQGSDGVSSQPIMENEDEGGDIQSEEEQQSESSDDESDDEQEIIEAGNYKGQSKGIKIPKDKRFTPPFLTKYERARVIGTRALQISKNSPIYVDPKDTSDPIAVAQQELNEKKIPFIIRRYLPNGDFEDWELQELESLD
ncbi:hypothetical protein pb186bvf_009550 [Paramecium bursaria]